MMNIFIYFNKNKLMMQLLVLQKKKKESIVINNKNIEKSISIYEGFQDNGWLFDIKMNNDMISVDTSISEEECIKIAENIMYY